MKCEKCEEKEKRIRELEAMIRRFADSFDEYEAKLEWQRTKARVIAEGPNVFTAKN